MNIFVQWLHDQGRQIVTQPLSREVAGTQDAYIQSEGLSKLGWRVIRRKIYLFFSGQSSLQRDKADPNWKKGLWIYFRTAQIGDSLMDLAARDFFQAHGCSVDLLTHEKLRALYEGDEWFGLVTSDVTSLKSDDYDFIIIQSIHHRALKSKIKFFKSKPWLCMQAFYDVPDFARTQWGAQRLMDFWNCAPTLEADTWAIQKLSTNKLVPMSQKHIDVTLVLGGMDPVRTYPYWGQVLSLLHGIENKSVMLIGTGDAADQAARDLLFRNAKLNITNKTNQLSLMQCIDKLAHTKLLLVADGGAMHLGVAVKVPKMISLFIKEIPPVLRIPSNYGDLAIISPTGLIRDIQPEEIAHKTQIAITQDSI